MQGDTRLFHAQLAFGKGQVDLTRLPVDDADNLLFGSFQAGAFDVVTRGCEVALVLLGCDASLRHSLIQAGLGLLQGRLFLL